MLVSFLKMKRAASILLVSIGIGAPMSVYSKVTELDVLGLIPGKSDRADVAKVSEEGLNFREVGFFTIGGHRMMCSTKFIGLVDNKLAMFTCFTGGTRTKYTEASNIEVHRILKEGFTQKFGKPSSVSLVPARTGIGVEYTIEMVSWDDQKGNKLTLIPMVGKVDEGALLMESAEFIKQRKAEEAAENANRKF